MKNRMLFCAAVLALVATTAGSEAKEPTMVDVAKRLHQNATPESFDRKCAGKGVKLEVAGDRHACSKPKATMIVTFAGEDPSQVTVVKKGVHKDVVAQLRRKHGAPSSVKTMGAMKMYFWFTKEANVSVGIQSSPESRSTMVSFRPPS